MELALCRATLFGALALGFRPPSEETVVRLTTEEQVSALIDAAHRLDAHGAFALAAAAAKLAPARATTVTELSARYRRIFGHTSRAAVPPYETEYGAEAIFQQPQELGDLMGFYRAFGLTLNPAAHERPDHVSCECEFFSFLALKEAYAWERRDDAMLQATENAQRLFLRDHLGRFAPTFMRKLCAETEESFYAALATVGHRLIALECRRLNVPTGPENLTLRPADPDGVPMACGSDAECPLTTTTGGGLPKP